jgi:Ni,Fe-hydrogenase III small subunit
MRTLLLRSLVRSPVTIDGPEAGPGAVHELTKTLDDLSRRVLGRSLALREVDAGSCNGCELEIHALNNPIYDLERLGLKFVASPRHADVLLVTGPLTRNMRVALERTWRATPDPKWVVALGDCACTGGLFSGSYACVGAVSEAVPVDLRIPGCPPRPIEILKGLIALMDAASRTGTAAPIGRPEAPAAEV